MLRRTLYPLVVGAIFLAAVNESQAQTGQRYQIQVRHSYYGITQWWPHGGGSYSYDAFLAVKRSLPSQGWQYVSYRIVGQDFNLPRGKSLQDYQREVQDAYRRAVEARNWAQGNIGRLTQQQFNQVNQLINTFNATLSAAQQGPYGSYFTGIARLSNIPSAWVVPANEPYGIYYRRRGGSWTYYRTVNGLSTAQQTCASLRAQNPGYEFAYQRR